MQMPSEYIELLEEYDFKINDYSDDDTIGIESWTSTGCDLELIVDMRNRDVDYAADWKDAIIEALNSYDPEEEAEINLQAYGNPGLAAMLEDFQDFRESTIEPLIDEFYRI